MKRLAPVLFGFVFILSLSIKAAPTSIDWFDSHGRTVAYEVLSTSPSCEYSDAFKVWTYKDVQTKAALQYAGPSRMIVTSYELKSVEHSEPLKLECVEVSAIYPVSKFLTTYCEMIIELPQQCVPREF
jgi:hypothetical protein